MRDGLNQFDRGHRSIRILQVGDGVSFVYARGDTMTVVPDGKIHENTTLVGVTETQASWKDLALEVTTRRPQKPETTRIYRISDEGRLEVVTLFRLPRGKETVEIVTVSGTLLTVPSLTISCKI